MFWFYFCGRFNYNHLSDERHSRYKRFREYLRRNVDSSDRRHEKHTTLGHRTWSILHSRSSTHEGRYTHSDESSSLMSMGQLVIFLIFFMPVSRQFGNRSEGSREEKFPAEIDDEEFLGCRHLSKRHSRGAFRIPGVFLCHAEHSSERTVAERQLYGVSQRVPDGGGVSVHPHRICPQWST